MSDFFDNYQDWIYIAVVVLAFFVFLIWNKKQQTTTRRSNRSSFKERVEQRKKDRKEIQG